MNVLIPMAGDGRRFRDQGYHYPKPLIETLPNKPMIQVVLESLEKAIDDKNKQYIFLVRKEDNLRYNYTKMFENMGLKATNIVIINVDKLTQGAACTALLAQEHIDREEPLIIANCDQYIEAKVPHRTEGGWDPRDLGYSWERNGRIWVFRSIHPKWSFVSVSFDDNQVTVQEVSEKRVISDLATCGIYEWTCGSDFVKYAKQMIAAEDRVNGEFYIAPVYNWAIKAGLEIGVLYVQKMRSLGVPEDLRLFQMEHLCQK